MAQKSMSKKKTCSVLCMFRSLTILKVPKSLLIVQASSLGLLRLSTAMCRHIVQTISSPVSGAGRFEPLGSTPLRDGRYTFLNLRLGTGLSAWDFPRFHPVCFHSLLNGDASVSKNVDIDCGNNVGRCITLGVGTQRTNRLR